MKRDPEPCRDGVLRSTLSKQFEIGAGRDRAVSTLPHAGSAGVMPSWNLPGKVGRESHRPLLTVRSKIPSVARRADSGTIGKRSLRSPLTFDQS